MTHSSSKLKSILTETVLPILGAPILLVFALVVVSVMWATRYGEVRE